MTQLSTFLAGVLIIAIVAVIVSNNSDVSGFITKVTGTLASWINSALSPAPAGK